MNQKTAIKPDPQFIVVDLFCGAGGTSVGFARAKYKGFTVAEVIACINHDPLAIRSHKLNFPNCIHFTEDVRQMDLRTLKAIVRYYRKKYPNAKLILWASLECTHFSNAKTGSRDADSRTLAWVLYSYIQKLRPDLVMIENVREFMSWGPLIGKVVKSKDAGDICPLTIDKKSGRLTGCFVPENRKKGQDYVKWRQTIESFGYRYKSKLLNSADFGSHQSRLRYFGVFAKPDMPVVFPDHTHDKQGRYGLPKWKAVREVLDLHEIGSSIFRRRKPLSPNTLKRILAGLLKFVANGQQSYLVKNYGGDPDGKAVSLDQPAPTVTTIPHEMLLTAAYLIRSNGGDPKDRVSDVDTPLNTLTTSPNQQLVTTDFLCQYNGTPDNCNFSADGSCRTLTTRDRFAFIRAANWIDNRTLNGRPSSVDGPAPTLVTNPTQSVVSVFIDNANRNGEPTGIDRPANTLVTEPRQSIVAVCLDNQYGHGGDERGATSLDDPSGTLMTVPKKNLVHAAFLDRQFGNSEGASIDQPCGTLTTEPKTNLVSAEFLMPTNYDNEPTSLDDPAPTITANRKWHYVVGTEPWLLTNMHQNEGSGLDQPAPTLLTGTHHYLLNPQFNSPGGSIDDACFTLIAKMDKRPPSLVTVEPENEGDPQVLLVDPVFFKDEEIDVMTRIQVFMAVYGIRDIYMRMLNIPELKRIQGLNVVGEPEYILEGPKDQQKKHIGNAVVPHVVTQWIQAYNTEILGLNFAPQLQLFA